MAVELVTTDGIFALDGGEWEVTNNIWLVGDDREVLIFDAAHDHRPIVDAVNGRRVAGIVLTHGHNDHINAAVALRDVVDAPILLHEADRMLWDVVYPNDTPDRAVEPGSKVGEEVVYLAAAARPVALAGEHFGDAEALVEHRSEDPQGRAVHLHRAVRDEDDELVLRPQDEVRAGDR